MKLRNHSKQRMKERTDYNHKDRRTLFRNALDNGLSIGNIKDERLKQYIMSKGNCKVKIYKGYIFIYSKNSKRLYTMYKLKDKYLEGSELNG